MKRLFPLVLVFATLLPAADAVYTIYVPQVADGGGWKTTFTIVNLSNTNEGDGTLRFHAEDGSALALPIVIGGTPGGAASQVQVAIPRSGILVVETAGTAAATAVGWAELNDQSVPSALALTTIFRQRTDQFLDYEASVVSLPVATKPLVFPYDNTVTSSGAAFATGIAVINANLNFVGAITVTVRDERGEVLQTDTMSLKALSHTAFSLKERYPVTAGRRGTIQFTPDSYVWLSAMGLRFNPTGPFTSLAALVQ